jgi:hypothetical protein
LRLFTAHLHAHQRGSQLLGFHFATHHRREQQVALLLAQGFGLIQLLEDRLNHVGLLEFRSAHARVCSSRRAPWW